MPQSLKHVICLFYSSILMTISVASWSESKELQVRTISVSPYGIEEPDRGRGIYYELAEALTSKLHTQHAMKVNHKIYPYARIIHELKNGQTDLTIMFKYQELEGFVTYIAPLPTLNNVVIGLNNTHFESIKSLEGKTLAYLRGAKFSDAIDNNHKIIKITTKDFQQGIDLLAAKRVDAIIGPLTPIISAAQELEEDDDFFGEPLIVSNRTPWLQISNQSQLLHSRAKVKKLFIDILSTNQLKLLRNKYLTHSRHLIE